MLRETRETRTPIVPDLTPFPALRYSHAAGDMSELLAPPYDVIDEFQAAELRARSPYNCVRLILPQGAPEVRYENGARSLQSWIGAGLLAADATPCVYVYRQTFSLRGRTTTRHAVFCALRLSAFQDGHVLPHERTHAGPKKDRLALTLATRTQLSPVFMIARDPAGAMLRLVSEAAAVAPAFCTATPDGVQHELWPAGGEAAARLCSSAGAEPLLIADGHHRYETALVAARELSDRVKATFLLICVVSQSDPGLVVQPTHRSFSDPPADGAGFDWLEALAESFQLESLGCIQPVEAESVAARAGGGSMVVMPAAAGDQAWLATPADVALEVAMLGSERRRLAPVVFDTLVLRQLYNTDADGAARAGIFTYARSPDAAVEAARMHGCAFLLPPVTLDDVWATASAGGRLPQKSTFFEPKIPSGLVFRTL